MLITSSQALDMMSAHAPRAWAKRVICWQIYCGQLDLMFASGTVTETLSAFNYLVRSMAEDGTRSVERVRAAFGDEIAAAVASVGEDGEVDVRKETWTKEARWFPIEVITLADDINWDDGTLSIDWDLGGIPDHDQDYLIRSEEDSHLAFALSEMCFELGSIEMMAPNAEAPKVDLFSLTETSMPDANARKGGPGRRREYDWDGALLHLIGQAEMHSIASDPHAHGAQADIVRRLADWFSLNGGKVPADSQLQSLARRALEAIKAAKP